ncbi:hypothetical protein LOAG_09727 [Loa loa]|uniref:Secreted protein n=1 Tax=Loa loa TaxID=7209 RepID=A0A1I7VEW6_LOALO|nr:hypothetical protein LOAG_09727 [Loa loa]EFO18767.1 hypothetical protein LOAG_09727 [Loa loa]
MFNIELGHWNYLSRLLIILRRKAIKNVPGKCVAQRQRKCSNASDKLLNASEGDTPAPNYDHTVLVLAATLTLQRDLRLCYSYNCGMCDTRGHSSNTDHLSNALPENQIDVIILGHPSFLQHPPQSI